MISGTSVAVQVAPPFAYEEAGIAQLQALMQAGSLTARSLTAAYLERILAIDRAGPRLQSVIEINPDAVTIAAALDAERRDKGPRGPLHGIPVLIKDNIASGDRMSTSAGSLALAQLQVSRDAFVTARLRAAGAVLLGKTNLSEWANIRSTRSTSGWSARGGLTRNPYALDRNTSGSSSGTGAAIAANLAAIGIGTETDGSIVSPSSINGLVGFKPTVGLVSRHGIVPISHSQDTAGPMTRSVADAAAVLTAIAGPDAADAATAGAPAGIDYTRFLTPDGLRGARLGVARGFLTGHDGVDAVFEAALARLREAGAVLVDPVEIPNVDKFGDAELDVLLYELKADLAAWLAEFAPGSSIKSLRDVIAFNKAHRDSEMPYFQQELFDKADALGDLGTPAYKAALETCRRYARAEGLDAVLKSERLDALIAPTGSVAWLTDFIRGDFSGASFSSPAAVAGYPHITVPSGFVSGLPVGLSFVGKAFDEGTLLRLAYGYEQATRARRAPTFPASVSVSL